MDAHPFVVLISANTEWRIVQEILAPARREPYPLGEWFTQPLPIAGETRDVLFVHGGWGKIAAAASTQYVIDHWNPALLVNLGTCGGFRGAVEKGTVLLVEKTIVYDIYEQMGDPEEHIAHYTSELDLSPFSEPYPQPVVRTLLVSGDRDIRPEEIGELRERFGAIAADWESGAIAWVATRNRVPLLILRGVSDLVGEEGGEAYENFSAFEEGTRQVMSNLLAHLPAWLAAFARSHTQNTSPRPS